MIESLSLFGELLGFQPPQKALAIGHFFIMGLSTKKAKEEAYFGPMIFYGKAHNQLKLIHESLPVSDKSKIEWMGQVAKGEAPASTEGPEVFQALIQSVLSG